MSAKVSTSITRTGLFGSMRLVSVTVTDDGGFDFAAEQVVPPKAVDATLAGILATARSAWDAMGDLDA
jgi:hypothetical protein